MDKLLRVLRSLAIGNGVLESKRTGLRATLTRVEVDAKDPTLWKLCFNYQPHAVHNQGRTGRDVHAYSHDVTKEFSIVSSDLLESVLAAHRSYDDAVKSQQTTLPYDLWLEKTVGNMQLFGEAKASVIH